MFDNNKFITKGVQQIIPLELQLFMWSCIDILKQQGKQLDYLQIFELTEQKSNNIFFQGIEYRQEVPEYVKRYKIFSNEIVNKKIYIIDDGTCSTMLLAEEY